MKTNGRFAKGVIHRKIAKNAEKIKNMVDSRGNSPRQLRRVKKEWILLYKRTNGMQMTLMNADTERNSKKQTRMARIIGMAKMEDKGGKAGEGPGIGDR